MKSEDAGLIVRAISFQDFQPMWSWSTNVTDRRTETTCDSKTALCTIVHRAVTTEHYFGNLIVWHSTLAKCDCNQSQKLPGLPNFMILFHATLC